MLRKAIIAGASGLIGNLLLDILLKAPEYNEIVILVRKKMPVTHGKLKQLIIDYDKLEDYSNMITGDVIFCCLGSTRKKTPGLKEYRKIDHDYPLRLAQIAKANGIGQYHLVSAIGANASASSFYTKMKGETERDIKNVGLRSLYIYQPSFLTGDRKESRIGERILIPVMKVIDPLLLGKLKKYRSISATIVARAMFKQSINNKEGVFIYTSDKIKEIS